MANINFTSLIVLILSIWDGFITLLTEFILVPLKIFAYLVIFSEHFLNLIDIVFKIIIFLINHSYLFLLLYIGIICVLSYIKSPNNPHDRLITFFKLFIKGFIYIVKESISLFKTLYQFSLKIINKIVEMIPVIQ